MAVNIINRSPSSAIYYQLPEERWTDNKPVLNHLIRFVYSAYVHTIEGKTCPRALKSVFMGYPFGVKEYRVWLPNEGKCVTSRNVVFNEGKFLKHMEAKYEGPSTVDVEVTYSRWSF